jgi:hypothetical protein
MDGRRLAFKSGCKASIVVTVSRYIIIVIIIRITVVSAGRGAYTCGNHSYHNYF